MYMYMAQAFCIHNDKRKGIHFCEPVPILEGI